MAALSRQHARRLRLDELPTHLTRNNLDYYYLSVWPGLRDLGRASAAELPERPALSRSGYVHFPFCSGVCDFCSYLLVASPRPEHDARVHDYLGHLLREFEIHRSTTRLDLSYVYFGGGTPSLMTPEQLARVLDGLAALDALSDQLVGTIELHPEAFRDRRRLDEQIDVLTSHGIGRVSIGFQAADPEFLSANNRRHDAEFLVEAMTALRDRGLLVNIDVMYGAPGQSLAGWLETLRIVLSVDPDSISTYCTFIDHGTGMFRQVRSGRVHPLEHLEIQTQHVAAQLVLGQAGYHELPNDFYARPIGDPAGYVQDSLPSEANSIAFGAGAYGYYPGVQYFNEFDLRSYADKITREVTPVWRAAVLTPAEDMCRDIMFSLKNAPYLALPLFERRYGASPLDTHPGQIRELVELGLADVRDARLTLTPKGRLLVEEIACLFEPARPAVEEVGISPRERYLREKHHYAPTYARHRTVVG